MRAPTSDPKPAQGPAATEAARCQNQLEDAFKTYFVPAKNANENEVLVAHGSVIRFLTLKALGADTRRYPTLSIARASLTIIRVRPGGSTSVVAVGDIGHIPPNLQSWSAAEDPQLTVPPP
jgi:serine/threonine-protein phosphatase PGAM5